MALVPVAVHVSVVIPDPVLSHTLIGFGLAVSFPVALVFGFVNAFIRPVAKILAFPLIIITLGLFSIVINALMLWLTSGLSAAFGFGFHVRGFWAAVLGAIVVSIVSTVIAMMLDER